MFTVKPVTIGNYAPVNCTTALILVNVNDQRTEAQLTDDIAKSFGTSLQTLIEAKSKCTI